MTAFPTGEEGILKVKVGKIEEDSYFFSGKFSRQRLPSLCSLASDYLKGHRSWTKSRGDMRVIL